MFESKANDEQVGGEHYRKAGKNEQHWDRVARLSLDYFQAQITKYVERCWEKNGVEDLRKAAHFLQKYIELSVESKRRGVQELSRERVHVGLEMVIMDLQQKMVNIEASTTKGTINDLQSKLDWLMTNIVVSEDGVFCFPDGDTYACLTGHPINPALDFNMEGAYGDGRTMWTCVRCKQKVYTQGTQKPHAVHHCLTHHLKQVPYDGVANRAQYEREAAHATVADGTELAVQGAEAPRT